MTFGWGAKAASVSFVAGLEAGAAEDFAGETAADLETDGLAGGFDLAVVPKAADASAEAAGARETAWSGGEDRWTG